MEQYKRDFKGIWVPKEIWLYRGLSILEKHVLSEIDSLDGEEGCFASNKYLAEFCDCSESAIDKAVKKLKELGLIYVKSFDGRVRVLKSCISISTPDQRKIYASETDCLRQSNIESNKESIKEKDISTFHSDISSEKKISKRFKKPTIEEIREYIKEQGYSIVPEAFYDYYESNGWHVGKNPMKDWKACVRTFQRNAEKYNYSNNKKNSNELALDREFIIG